MQAFAELVDKLYFNSSNLAKSAILRDYLRTTPDPDRGWAIAAIAGTLTFELFKRKVIKDLISTRVDPTLFELSYDYVGEMSETVAHLWPSTSQLSDDLDVINKEGNSLPSLDELVTLFQQSNKQQVEEILVNLLNKMTAPQRWALIKLGTRGLRIGLSARFLKKVLAEYSNQVSIASQSKQDAISVEDIERVWHGVEPPYTNLFAWLEGAADKPDVSKKITFQPVMLSHPLSDHEVNDLNTQHWQAEWKYDGIRVQLVCNDNGKALFSRTGDDISASFPDLLDSIDEATLSGVFDGELLAMQGTQINSFNQLQQRLNKKKPSKQLMQKIPVGMMLYDALFINSVDIRELPLYERVAILTEWYRTHSPPLLQLSRPLTFSTIDELRTLRQQANDLNNGYIEGLMLKRLNSNYMAGRPKGQWFKWKRDAKLIDAVMMYAQRGHGKRSSFYSDYTFGCWQGEQLLPVGKAYSGFTDEELKLIDKWVRNNTIGRFGPVKEVKKELVFEVAFDSVHHSKRHKSGVALRFPRIHRIRWDKPGAEADVLSSLQNMIEE
jgi:DNA ligase-1